MAGNDHDTAPVSAEKPGDFSARRRKAERARHAFEAGARVIPIHPEVLASWRRSRTVRADLSAAPADESGTAVVMWRDSHFALAAREVLGQLASAVDRQTMVAAVLDHRGRIVWQHASAPLRRDVERVNFVPGGCWDELSTGTTAPALALRGEAADVFANEHSWPRLEDWACCAVPVIDPSTRQILGALNLSCHVSHASPLMMALADSVARRIEDRLVGLAPASRLCLLGRGELRLNGRTLHVSRRQLEILLALSQARDGLSLEQLYVQVYERDDVHPSSLKAEVSRLRTTLDGLLGSRPYRLQGAFGCDVNDVRERLVRGDVAGALDIYTGPVLPWSSAPVACRTRAWLQMALRTQALASADPRIRLRYLSAHPDEADLLDD